MNGNCLDIGTIQAFLDGETRPEQAVSISDHVASCDACTVLLAQAEDESSMVFSVLDRELNTLVPTQRLWNRINDSINDEKSRASILQRLAAFVTVSIANPSFSVAAGLLLLVGIVAGVWTMNSSTEPTSVAGTQPVPISTTAIPESFEPGPVNIGAAVTDDKTARPESGVTRSNLSERELKRMVINANYVERDPKKVYAVPASSGSQYLPGEESYIKTINELQQGVTVQNASMSASNQVAFQRDLAVVDDSIEKMRKVVKKNPRNQAARQVLYSSYQDKIELLRSSAQRDELMASLQ